MSTDIEELGLDDEPVAKNAAPKGRFNLRSKKARILMLLAAVMGVEAAVIYAVLPQPADVGGEKEHTLVPEEEESAGLSADTVEVQIGKFNCTNSIAAPGRLIHIDCTVTAIVAKGQEIAFADAAKKQNEARVRQAILKVCRSSSLEDLSDPELGVIKRKIREEVNKALKKSYVIEIVISDFKRMEQ